MRAQPRKPGSRCVGGFKMGLVKFGGFSSLCCTYLCINCAARGLHCCTRVVCARREARWNFPRRPVNAGTFGLCFLLCANTNRWCVQSSDYSRNQGLSARRLVLTVACLLSAVAARCGLDDLASELATIGEKKPAPHDPAFKYALARIVDAATLPLGRALALAAYVFISASVRVPHARCW